MGRRGKEQQAELAEIEALIAAGKVRFTRVVRTVINGRDIYRMQLVCDGYPTRRHPVGDGQVWFDLGPSEIAVAVERSDGTWTGWIEPLADRVRLDTVRLRRAQRHLDCQHRAGSRAASTPMAPTNPAAATGRRSRTAQRTIAGVAERHRRLAEHRKTFHGALANRLFAQGANVACEKLDHVAWQRTSGAVCGTGHRGCWWQTMRRKADSAGGDRLDEYNPNITALSQPACAGTARTSCSRNGSTAASAASRKTGTCSRPIWDCTSAGRLMVSTGWTWRQQIMVGCSVVRTSMVVEAQS